MDEEDKCSLKELIRRMGLPLRGGSLNDPPPNPNDYNEGKAIYVNDPGFYSIFGRRAKGARRAHLYKY